MADLGPQNGEVLFENISNDDGELGQYTGDTYKTVAMNAFRERGGDPTGFYASEIYDDGNLFKGEFSGISQGIITLPDGTKVSAFDRALSAARGDAFNRNIYTGRADFRARGLEEGSREAFNKVLSRYIGQEDLPQEYIRKAYKNNGNDLQKATHGVFYSIPAFVGALKTGGKKATELSIKYGPELGKKMIKSRQGKNKATRIVRLMAQSRCTNGKNVNESKL